MTARQQKGDLSADHQAQPGDQESTPKAVEIPACNHQGLTGDEGKKDLENEQNGQDEWAPESQMVHGDGNSLTVAKPSPDGQ